MSSAPRPGRIHGSCVSHQGRGALIIGGSGSGKSSLALRLVALGAELVADDQVDLSVEGDHVVAASPEPIRGLLEVRGAGLLRVRTVDTTRLILAVDMDASTDARLPPLRQFCITSLCLPLIAGKNLPNLESLVMACLRQGDEPLFQDPDA